MAAIVAVAANDDEVVKPGASYRENALYPQLKTSLKVLALHGPDAKKSHADHAMSRPEVRLFTGLGHGTDEVFRGQYGQPIYTAAQAGSSPGVHGRIFHLCACSTAQKLGPALLQAGASAFFGYAAPVLVNLDDPVFFFAADAEIDIALAAGSTCEQALERSVEAFQDAIEQAEEAGDGLSAGFLRLAAEDLRGPSAGELEWGSPSTTLK